MSITAQSLLYQINQIMVLITDSRMALMEGRVVDLVEVQGRVSDLCSTIQHNPELEDEDLADAITKLVTDFDTLGQELTEHQKSLSQEVIRKSLQDPDSGNN